MATSDPNMEEEKNYFTSEVLKSYMASFEIAGFGVEKIIRRAEAISFIKQIEKGGESHGIRLIMSTLLTLGNNLFYLPNYILSIVDTEIKFKDDGENDALFDKQLKERDYLSMQHSSNRSFEDLDFDKRQASNK